ncbi:hypothetical protein MPSEU_000765000 [Mayamaea pseudoterrestris]|nr:hypothetical protein MPSEU_000765000 [Mayamaea pseudoterrestris]
MSVSDAGIFALEDEELKKEFEKVDRGEKSILSIPSNLYKFIGPDRSLFSKCIVLWWILLDVSDRRELIKGSWRHSDSTRRAMLDKLQQINHLVKQMTSRMNTQQIEKLSPQLRPFVLGVAKRIFKYERTQASVDQWKLESFLDKYCLEDWIKIGKFVPKGGPPGMDCQNEDGSKPKDDQVVDEMKDLEDDMRRISIGEINNGQIMKGEQRYEDGSSYKGTFRNGLMHGQGCFKYSDGRTIYQGNYCNGFAHGYGEQLKDNGSSGYKGIWEYDKMSEGLLHYVDSDGKTVYNGEIKDGEFHGNGELTLTNGACYKGSFVNGMYDGQGKFTWSSSQWYEGTFRQDKPHGYGESMCDGNGYKGNFVNGEFNGQGKLTLSNGDWCKGEFKEGKFQNGFGKLTYVDGSLYEGNLLNDKYEGQGKVSMSDGDWYKGEFKEDKFLYGYGKVTWIDGNSYEGSFLNGKFEGQGKYIWSNGNCYEGEFKDGNFHGAGKLKLCDGTCREGTFADDEFVDGFFTDFHPDGTLRSAFDCGWRFDFQELRLSTKRY